MGLRIPCLRCGKFEPECRCEPLPREPEPPPAAAPPPPAWKPEGSIKIRREKRGGGREVVILEGFPPEEDLTALVAELKRKLGTGGSAKEGTIEIQGDQRSRLSELLSKRGYRVVRAGG